MTIKPVVERPALALSRFLVLVVLGLHACVTVLGLPSNEGFFLEIEPPVWRNPALPALPMDESYPREVICSLLAPSHLTLVMSVSFGKCHPHLSVVL